MLVSCIQSLDAIAFRWPLPPLFLSTFSYVLFLLVRRNVASYYACSALHSSLLSYILLLTTHLLPPTTTLPSSISSSPDLSLSLRSAENTKIIQDGMPPTPACGDKLRLEWVCKGSCFDKHGNKHGCKDLNAGKDGNAATDTQDVSQYACVSECTGGRGGGALVALLGCLTVEATIGYFKLPQRYQCDCDMDPGN